MKNIVILPLLLVALLTQTSCSKDYLNTEPSSDVSSSVLFKTYEGGLSLIVGTNRNRFAADNNTHQFAFGERSATLQWDYMGEDFFAVGLQSYGMLWTNMQNLHCEMDDARLTAQPWNKFYSYIDNVNQIVGNIGLIQGATPQQLDFLKGQALVYRGHMYHLLVQAYAQSYHTSPDEPGVPLSLKPVSEPSARATVAQVYAQIEADLKEAEALMASITPLHPLRKSKAFADLAVVKGLLSRVYLCKHDWENAAKYAKEARVGYPLMSKAQYADGFFTMNDEWMWASIVPADEANSFATFPAEVTNGDAADMYPAAWSFDNCVNKNLPAATDAADCRFATLLSNCKDGFGVPVQKIAYNKYRWKLGTPYDLVYMRGAEMLLNEAEAYCMQGGKDAMVKILLKELISARVSATYAAKVDAMTAEQLLAEVKIQRRIEMWGEGTRYFDLKRRGETLDRRDNGANQGNYLTAVITSPTSRYWVYRIPKSETNSNALVKQNNYPL